MIQKNYILVDAITEVNLGIYATKEAAKCMQEFLNSDTYIIEEDEYYQVD